MNHAETVNFIWTVADLLRGPYRPNQYKDVMLPMTALRRFDCVLEPTKADVLAYVQKHDTLDSFADRELKTLTGHQFYNTSQYTFQKLLADPPNIASNLVDYIKGFSPEARDILEKFDFEKEVSKLNDANRLFLLAQKFAEVDVHPDRVSNYDMGGIFEELIRRFNEASNEEAGDHFTPREVIRLMVDVLFLPDKDILTTGSIVKTIFDPACGTGGMLSVSEEYIFELNSAAKVILFGQDYNPQSYAICGSDMLIKGQDIDNIAFGDSFTHDNFEGNTFDYCLVNPPFGVEWKPQADFIKNEHEVAGDDGRFGVGLPRINDGSLLFLQHLISKMQLPNEGGTRMAIVFNGSPLFTGAAGSGESEIRRWILEQDWLEGIIALPDQLFYNTGIYTYIWILSNRKTPERRGKVQLVDGTSFYRKMRKSLGNKRNLISDEHRQELTCLYGDFSEGEHVKIFDTTDFGYHRITVERPLRLNFAVTDERLAHVQETSQFSKLASSKKRKDKAAAEREIAAGKAQQADILAALASLKGTTSQDRDAFAKKLKRVFKQRDLKVPATLFNTILSALSETDDTAPVCKDKKGDIESDSSLRDNENIPLKEDIDSYMAKEVLPHVPDAWVDDSKIKVGYEINFNRYFYQYEPPRPLVEIESDLTQIEAEIAQMLAEIAQ